MSEELNDKNVAGLASAPRTGSVSFQKVSVNIGGSMHIQHQTQDGYTLCGLKWFFLNDHGDTYCRNCQRILAGIRRKQNATGELPRIGKD